MTQDLQGQVQAALANFADFERGSAYDRTKLCCEVLTKMGLAIPSWMVIRDYIGKGSAGDISRGVKDYRAEHAKLLQRMDGLPEGIPAGLGQPMQALWRAALDEATTVYEQERATFEAQQAEAARAVDEALRERDTMESALALANEKASGLQAALEQEKERANTERAAREQAERMAEKHIADLTQQRNEMMKVIEANTLELRTLTNRLEDERRRALMQIEEARQKVELARQQALREGEQRTAKIEAQLRKEMADQNLEHFLLQRRYSEQEARNSKLQELLNQETKRPGARPGQKTRITARRPPALASRQSRRLKGKLATKTQ